MVLVVAEEFCMFRPTLVVIFSAIVFSALAAQEPAAAPQQSNGAISHDRQSGSKWDLTQERFEQLHTLIRPQPNEWRHLQVHWMTDVIPARKKAATEDKPLIICYTGGAGYNEPLGIC
jgi:hypothetical protein